MSKDLDKIKKAAAAGRSASLPPGYPKDTRARDAANRADARARIVPDQEARAKAAIRAKAKDRGY